MGWRTPVPLDVSSFTSNRHPKGESITLGVHEDFTTGKFSVALSVLFASREVNTFITDKPSSCAL